MPIIQALFYNSVVAIPYLLYLWGSGYGIGTGGTGASTPVTTFAGGTTWKQISCGDSHTAAIKNDGTLWTWGSQFSPDNRLGQNLYINGGVTVSTPITTFAGGTNWKQVSCGYRHTLAIKTDGTLWTWGHPNDGQLGTIDALEFRLTPVTTFAGGTNWADTATTDPSDLYTIGISASTTSNTFAIKSDGTLWGWGSNSDRNVGNAQGTAVVTTGVLGAQTPVTTFAGGTDWKQVFCGNQHTAAIKTDGTLWIWGSPISGKMGNAITSTSISTPVTTFAGGTNWKQVCCSNTFSVAIKTDGTLWTWGEPSGGKLGNRVVSFGLSVSTPITTFAGGTDWKQVSCGRGHTAAVKTDGTLWTWGYSSNGRLGNSATSIDRSTPITTFAGGTDWKQVSCGYSHTAAIKTDGTLWMWGFENNGRLGNGVATFSNVSTPITTFAGGTDWKQVSCGNQHTAAIKTDGTLWTWGYSSYGRLGNNINSNGGISTPITTFAGGTNWKQVCCGDRHVIALQDDGVNKQIFLWGRNNEQQLGINNIAQFVLSGTNWDQADASIFSHSAAIKTDGTLWVWGRNNQAQLGSGDLNNRFTPITTFAGGTNWKQVSCGNNAIAATKTDGTLWIWGGTRGDILGIPPTNDLADAPFQISTPITTFAGGTNWKQVSCGGQSDNIVTAIKTDGTLWTWGSLVNLLGTKSGLRYRDTPVTTFAGGTNWADTATTDPSDLYTIFTTGTSGAIKTDGTLWTWGYNGRGQIGNGTISAVNTPITTFAGGTDWKEVSGGSSATRHCAAIKTDGTLWTWGDLGSGKLGNRLTSGLVSTPITTFAGGTNWKQVSCGNGFTAAIKTDGTLWTWGSSGSGALANRLVTGNISTPVTTFAGGTNWNQVSSSGVYAAAIKTDGTLWMWGSASNGRLGNSVTSINRSTPVTTFAGGTDWKQVSCGNQHTAAIKTDGTLWTWGYASRGRLGNGVTTFSNVSTPITTFAGGTDWKQVCCGNDFTAAVKTDGTLWTWGYSSYGAIGNGNNNTISTPITTFAGGTNWKQVCCGYNNVIALQDDGVNKQIFLWGRDWRKGLFDMSLGIKTVVVNQYQIDGNNWSIINSKGGSGVAAIKTDGTLWNWGTNGILGANDNVIRPTPITTFLGGTKWIDISSGRNVIAGITT